MGRILIFGNSGSGKSTLAGQLSKSRELAHLDLDTLAWEPTLPPQRKPLPESESAMRAFMVSNPAWVIEGCYSDMLELAMPFSDEIIFLNLPVEVCIQNARRRPWEPHKYESKEAQDANLEMLVQWIAQYPRREDTFSQSSHEKLYNQYIGTKRMITRNE